MERSGSTRRRSDGWVVKPDRDAIDRQLSSIRLLDRKRMRELSPDAELHAETFLGLTKSLIAIRR